MHEHWLGLEPKRRRLVSGIVGACMGVLFFCCLGGYQGVLAVDLARRGVTTTATVVGVRHVAKGPPEVTVQFEASNGTPVTARCDGCAPDLSEGDTVRVRYDPRFPNDQVENPDAPVSRRIAIFGGSVAFVSLTAAGVLAWLLVRENRRLGLIRSAS